MTLAQKKLWIDREQLAEELGVSEGTARAIMSQLPLIHHGRRKLVDPTDVERFIDNHTTLPDGGYDLEYAPTSVYIVRARDGACLYVGITGQNLRRLHWHSHRAEWWPQAAAIDVEHFFYREWALEREARLIYELAPRFNRSLGSVPEPKRPSKRGGTVVELRARRES